MKLYTDLFYYRKRQTTNLNGQKHAANDKPHGYIRVNPWELVLPVHRQLQYSSKTTAIPLIRFNSDNFLTDHSLQYQDIRGNTAPYLPNDQPTKVAAALSNPITDGITINKANAKSIQVLEPKGNNCNDDDDDDMDIIPSITHPSYVYIKESKI